MEFRGHVETVTFRNEDNGYSVLRVRGDSLTQPVTVVGNFGMIHPGETFEFSGRWVQHQAYGKQFHVERSVPVRPNTIEGIKKYLGSGLIDGVGAATADRIVAQFGLKTFEILDNNPHRLREVNTIGKKKAKTIIGAWEGNKAHQDVQMFCVSHGISPVLMQRVLLKYGADAIAVIAQNPYRLAAEIRGIGFLRADDIGKSVGIDPESEHRIRAAIAHVLEQSHDRGHCFLSRNQIVTELAQLLRISAESISGKLAPLLCALGNEGRIVSENMEVEGKLVEVCFTAEIFAAELAVAQKLGALLASPVRTDQARLDEWISRYSEAAQAQLSEGQRTAVLMAATNRVFILTGGPGVGKTTTANAIIRLLKAMGRSVALAAPTGRAAQRLMQVAAIPARTIHRMLEWSPGGFMRNHMRTIEADVVVIDEASMLDIRLMAAVMDAVPDTAQIVLIGDIDQLPAIGPGSVLRDLINANVVPCVRLNEIFRQAATSKIIQTAHAINSGNRPEFSPDEASDCRFIEHNDPVAIKEAIKHLVTIEIPQRYGLDPKRDIQILTPMNRGELGTQCLNDELQALLNPMGPDSFEFKTPSGSFRIGDKVIQCVNNYELGVFNGDIGFVDHAAVDGGNVIVSYGERQVAYAGDQVRDLRLAYAITIHKSQGSEFPAVVIPLSTMHYIMLQRNLVYTALTRAKNLAVFVGSSRALQTAIRSHSSTSRQTRLIERLQEERR